jgi:hypothetical protein
LAAQAAPHALQCWASVIRLVSQPLLALASQLPKPALQLDTWHEPELQLEAALLSAHARLHWPQCVAVFKRCSQPSALLELQLP